MIHIIDLQTQLYLLIALAVTGTLAAEESDQSNGAAPEGKAEPYAYSYETDSHAASQQSDENGKVTGFYTLADADGRSRKVEYYADASGFHAKVQTNEVGTKSESPADVQLLASPPNAEQLVYHTQVVQQSPPQQFFSQQQVRAPQQQAISYQYQQPGSIYYQQQPGYVYGYSNLYQQPQVSRVTYGSSGSGVYGGYNSIPTSYYSGVAQPLQYNPAVYRSVSVPAGSSSYSYQSYSGPQVGVPNIQAVARS